MKSLFDIINVDYNAIIGRKIGNVTILKELGRGNKGVVFVGFQHTLKRKVAVKILVKNIVAKSNTAQQFTDEAEIVATLSHPNIIPIFEMGETDDFYFQIMQLVEGCDLDAIINKKQKHPIPSQRLLSLQQSCDYMIKILEGLGYAHEDGVIHRDMKPANVLVESRTGRPLIADFGIALTAEMEYKANGIIMGSPLYLAPEQAATDDIDNRVDIYSVGILFYKLLTGTLPMHGKSVEEILSLKIQSPDNFIDHKLSDVSPIVNNELETIFQKAVATNRDDRYTTCFEFKDVLSNFSKSL